MSHEEDAKSLRFLDRRVVERNIKKGLVTRKDYDKFLKSLPDCRENVASDKPHGDD